MFDQLAATTPEMDQPKTARPKKVRRGLALGAMLLVLGSSGCTLTVPYGNHGYYFCWLNFGPEVPTFLEGTNYVRFPVLGNDVWEACHNHD